MTRLRRGAFGMAIALALSLVGPSAFADAEDDARARVKRGLELYDEGEYRLSLSELQRAYDLVPNYKVLYNIGQVRIQLGEYAEAQRVLRRYLDDGKEEIGAERRADVEKDLAMLAFGNDVKENQYLHTEDFLDVLDRNLKEKWKY